MTGGLDFQLAVDLVEAALKIGRLVVVFLLLNIMQTFLAAIPLFTYSWITDFRYGYIFHLHTGLPDWENKGCTSTLTPFVFVFVVLI